MPRKLLVQADRPDAEAPETWQLLVPYGRWHHRRYGTVDHSKARVQRYHDHFKAGLKLQGEPGRLPFGFDHQDGQGASGWIHDVRLSEAGLEAKIRWTPAGVQAITDETYPFVSPDLVPMYTDPETRTQTPDVLAGGSLCIRPFFKSLPQVYLESYSDDPEPLVLWCDPDEPESFMDDDQVRTNPEQPGADPHEDTPTELVTRSVGEPSPPASAAFAEQPDPREDDTVDLQSYRELRDEVGRLRRESRVRHFTDELEGWRFADKRQMAPVCRGALAELLADLDDETASRFAEVLKGLRFYQPGVVGLEGEAEPVVQCTEEDRAVAEQLGLEPEEVAR